MNPLTEPRTRPHLAAALVALVALLLYARTVEYEYVWDDLTYLQGFSQYKGLAGAISSFTEPFYLYSSYYRPLAMLSFVISAEPSVQHGINVVLHALNTVLVLHVARALMPQEVADSRAGIVSAALGALLFAVHPVTVESTVWVSGRFDTLMCSFALATCLAAFGEELTRRRLALVFVLFACAMGSKESAVGLPVALPFLLLLKWRLAGMETEQMKAQAGVFMRLLLALTLAVGLYIAVRLAVVHGLFADKATFAGGSVLDKLNVAALAVTALAQLIVAPLSHSVPMHLFAYERGSGVQGYTLMVIGCVAVLLAVIFLKKPKLNFPLALLAALGMSWPVLHLIGIPNGENIISDRYALVPLALLVVGLAATSGAWVVRRVPELGEGGRRLPLYAAAASLLWAGALGAYSNVTIPVWRSEKSLWAFAHHQVPESVNAHKNYINQLTMESRWNEASAELAKFWDMHPEHAGRMDIQDVSRWMLIRAKVGDYDGARELARMVEERGEEMLGVLQPNILGIFYATCGTIEMDAAHWPQARRYFERAMKVSPMEWRLGFPLAYVLFKMGQTVRSDEVFEWALSQATSDIAEQEKQKREIWRRQAPAPAAAREAGDDS